MKITQIPMGAHNAQLTCYLQDPCTEMPALDRCPAILIFPGGAYAFCSDREADPVALAFLNAGYNAFVLRYSVSQNCPVEEVYTNAFAEAQEAMDYLHQNAGDLHIDPEQIAVVGFSAGGHLAASAPASRKRCREPPSLGPSTSTSYPMLRSTGTALTSTMGAPVISSTWLIIKARLPWAENASSAQMPRS